MGEVEREGTSRELYFCTVSAALLNVHIIARTHTHTHIFIQLPSFHAVIEIKLKSSIPALARICPSETVRLWKTERGLRIDWSIAKARGLKLTRAPMSLLFHVDGTSLVRNSRPTISVVNHDEQVYEELFPNTSKSIVHDLVDAYLREGVRTDELPLEEYRWSRATSTSVLGGGKATAEKKKMKTMRKSRFKTEVFEMAGMCWRQKTRVPLVVGWAYDKCDEKCRGGSDKGKRGKEVASHRRQVDNLEALQFISESDLAVADVDDAVDATIVSTSAQMSNVTSTETFDEMLKNKLTIDDKSQHGQTPPNKLHKIVGGHARQRTAATVKLGNVTATSSVARDVPVDASSGADAHATGTVTATGITTDSPSSPDYTYHTRSYPPPPPPRATFDEYFDPGSSATMQIGRDCEWDHENFTSDKPLLVYLTDTSNDDNFPLSLNDLLPLVEWATARLIPSGQFRRFIAKHAIGDGLPVRVEMSLFKMVALKASVVKLERGVGSTTTTTEEAGQDGFFQVPCTFEMGEIFPMVEVEVD